MLNEQRSQLGRWALAAVAAAFAAAPAASPLPFQEMAGDGCGRTPAQPDSDFELASATLLGRDLAGRCQMPAGECGTVRDWLTRMLLCPLRASDALGFSFASGGFDYGGWATFGSEPDGFSPLSTLLIRQQAIEAPTPSNGVAPLSLVRAVAGESLESATPWLASSWKTGEYSRSATVGTRTGASQLNLINAAEGYARRITGRPGGGGITVAVIDTGINAAHPQIDVARAFDYGAVDNVHGTYMAGVIAARRDSDSIHGVAYNANLVSIGRVPTAETAPVDASAADIASAAGLTRTYGTYQSTPEASSHILNMSWGETGRVPVIRSAMEEAASAGRIMVASLGNDGGTEPNGAPAIHVADEGIAGFAIAAGWLNEAGTGRHDDANNCGAVARYCLFAPGTNILSLSTAAPLGYSVTSGSSHSTAYVSGAAAVVWAAFPNKAGDQIVGRLLSTARPLDGQEISSTYGHGALDLGAAMNPVGFLSLFLKDAGLAPLAASFINLPPGFAAPPADAVLANAVVYDQQMFPFLADLNAVFRTAPQRPPAGLTEWMPGVLSGLPPTAWRNGYEHWNSVGSAFRPHPWEGRAAWESLQPGSARGLPLAWKSPWTYHMEFQPTPNLSLAVGKGFGAFAAPNDFIAGRMRGNPLSDQFSTNPFAAFTGWGEGFGLSWRLGPHTALDFASKRGEGYFGAARNHFASAGLTRDLGTLSLGVRYGFLDESGSWLGVRTQGAFDGLRDGRTAFLDMRIQGRFAERMTLFGSLSRGTTAGGAARPGTLIAKWSKARARSFLVGGEVEGLWSASDRLTLTAAMPFRVRQAKIHLDVPHRELADGVVSYTRQTVDLRPQGREIQLQLAYATEALEQRLSLSLGAGLRLQPNHSPTAGPEFSAALRMRLVF